MSLDFAADKFATTESTQFSACTTPQSRHISVNDSVRSLPAGLRRRNVATDQWKCRSCCDFTPLQPRNWLQTICRPAGSTIVF